VKHPKDTDGKPGACQGMPEDGRAESHVDHHQAAEAKEGHTQRDTPKRNIEEVHLLQKLQFLRCPFQLPFVTLP